VRKRVFGLEYSDFDAAEEHVQSEMSKPQKVCGGTIHGAGADSVGTKIVKFIKEIETSRRSTKPYQYK